MRIVPEKNRRVKVGDEFFRATAIGIEFYVKRNEAHPRPHVVCECQCGSVFVAMTKLLLNDHIKSCGCYAQDNRSRVGKSNAGRVVTHGLAGTKLYSVWGTMKSRCKRVSDRKYPWYGGRGIRLCEEWNEFPNFYEWAMQNGYCDGLTIDRIDTDGNYEPGNCQWISREDNSRKTLIDRPEMRGQNGQFVECVAK